MQSHETYGEAIKTVTPNWHCRGGVAGSMYVLVPVFCFLGTPPFPSVELTLLFCALVATKRHLWFLNPGHSQIPEGRSSYETREQS